jgi:hypothetical protein
MNYRRILAMAFALITALSFGASVSRADDRSQLTKLTFSQAVEVPGQVLPPGSYWFVLADLGSERNVVQIFSEDWSTLYATVLTIPAERQQPSDGITLTFAERPSSQPEAVLTWFYPGKAYGHEFVYPAWEEHQLSPSVRQSVAVESSTY